MGSPGKIILGIAGAIVGFVVGGPGGAVVGFSLGFSVGGLLFPPDISTPTQTTDSFNVTGASEGSPPAFVLGRRVVKGNIIFFGDVVTEEVTEDPGKGGGGGEYVVEVRPYAPVHITLCLDTLLTLHEVADGKGRNWEQLNSDVGGAPLQISTGIGTDFGYLPDAVPMPGVTSVYSDALFLGENARTFPPLSFDVSVLPDATVGDPTLGLSSGVNPANAYWHILTNLQYGLGLDPSSLNLASFQAAYTIYKDEDRGLNVLLENATTFKRMVEVLNFHTNSILRVDSEGRLELFPLRWGNWTAVPVAESECKDAQVSVRTWAFVDNDFVATFPDEANRYTQRTIRQKNEAVQEMVGSSQTRTYDFPWFTDIDNATRRLSELMEAHSFPDSVLAIKVSKKFHDIRPGSVIALTHSAYGFDGTPSNGYFRILEVQDADFGKTGMLLKGLQIREPLSTNYVPPIPAPAPPIPIVDPLPPLAVGGLSPKWRSHRHPPEIGSPKGIPAPAPGAPPGGGGAPIGSPQQLSPLEPEANFFGYPMPFWAARGGGRDVLYMMETAHAKTANLPVGEAGRTISNRWAFGFYAAQTIGAKQHFRGDEPLPVSLNGFSGQLLPDFGLDSADANGFFRKQETGPWALLIGNTEIALFEQIVLVNGTDYEIYGLKRGANKEYLYEWPTNTPLLVINLRPFSRQIGLPQSEWAFRQRYIRQVDYDDPTLLARIRTFFQTADLAGHVQRPDQGWNGVNGETWEDRAGAIAHASGFYAPANEHLANRGPMPTCQAYKKGTSGSGVERSWYAEDNGIGASGDWIVELPPFPDDSTGIGDRVAYDQLETVGEPFGPPVDPWERFHGPTDLPFNDHVGASAAVNGQLYRLFIMANITQDPLVDTPIREIDVSFSGAEVEWPAFLYTVALQITDGVTSLGATIAFWVAVRGRGNHFCRPRLVDKIGFAWPPQEDPLLAIVPS